MFTIVSNSNDEPFDTLVVCPICLKPGLKFVHEFTSIWATPPKRYCPHCKYNGILVFEINKDEYYSVPESERDKWLEEIKSGKHLKDYELYCDYCDALLEQSDEFCHNCGKKVPSNEKQ